MTKITMIGAGSTVFMKNLVGDILHDPRLAGAEIALMDIDQKRLATSAVGAGRVAAQLCSHPAISTTTARRAALVGADYHEYAARIIAAELSGEPTVINGVQPVRVGRMPTQLAALMQTNINVQEPAVEAIATSRLGHVKHAAMLDPHTAAELSMQESSDLVDDLVAHGSWPSRMAETAQKLLNAAE